MLSVLESAMNSIPRMRPDHLTLDLPRAVSMATIQPAVAGLSPQHACDRLADPGGRIDDRHAGLAQRGDLLRRRSLSPRDDRPRVTHPAARWSGPSRNEGHERLREALAHPARRLLLRRAPDLADHHDRARLGVLSEEREDVDEARADDRVAADSDARGLADAAARELINGLVGQRPAPRDHPDMPLAMNVSWHDPDLGSPGRDDSRA